MFSNRASNVTILPNCQGEFLISFALRYVRNVSQRGPPVQNVRRREKGSIRDRITALSSMSAKRVATFLHHVPAPALCRYASLFCVRRQMHARTCPRRKVNAARVSLFLYIALYETPKSSLRRANSLISESTRFRCEPPQNTAAVGPDRSRAGLVKP